jgi:hypothetical protein
MKTSNTPAWAEQMKGWAMLKGLRPTALELDRVQRLRDASPEWLSQPGHLEALMLELGLNDEGLKELPEALHPLCGGGLRVWQYPIQFSPYLRHLSRLGVRSYVELGIRHGGSFVLTVEYLERFRPLDFAVGVDIIPCPSMEEYKTLNPRSEFACVNTQSPAFAALLERLGRIDLVFIDSHHQEEQCRREFRSLMEVANMVAFHDVSNVNCPGVRAVWEEIKAMEQYACFEFIDQYAGLGPYMGIGLAVKKQRLAEAA